MKTEKKYLVQTTDTNMRTILETNSKDSLLDWIRETLQWAVRSDGKSESSERWVKAHGYIIKKSISGIETALKKVLESDITGCSFF
jgi:hypothetical protein